MHSMEIKEIYYNTFYEKFREINVLTKEVTKELISRKKISVRENFMFFHTVMCDCVVSHCGNYGILRLKIFAKIS